jgi:hypothetical protein
MTSFIDLARIAVLALVALAPLLAGPVLAQQSRGAVVEKVRNACGADIQKLCAGVQQGGGRVLQCLREHQSDVSEGCQTAMKDIPSRR